MDPFSPQPDAYVPPAPEPGQERRFPRWAAALLSLVGLLVAAEVGYWLFDQCFSHEVRIGGVALPGIAISGIDPAFTISSPHAFHAMQIAVSSHNCVASEAVTARNGVPGTMFVQELGGEGRSWEIQCVLLAPESAIRRHSSVEDGLLQRGADTLVALGTRYRVDFRILPRPASEKDLADLESARFPAGTSLSFRFDLDSPLNERSFAYVSYSRFPLFLHQRLLRPSVAEDGDDER